MRTKNHGGKSRQALALCCIVPSDSTLKHMKSSLSDPRRLFERTVTVSDVRDVAESLKFVESRHGNTKDISVYGQEFTATNYKPDKAVIKYRQDYCEGIYSTDFLIEKDDKRMALECKANVERDIAKTVTQAEL